MSIELTLQCHIGDRRDRFSPPSEQHATKGSKFSMSVSIAPLRKLFLSFTRLRKNFLSPIKSRQRGTYASCSNRKENSALWFAIDFHSASAARPAESVFYNWIDLCRVTTFGFRPASALNSTWEILYCLFCHAYELQQKFPTRDNECVSLF